MKCLTTFLFHALTYVLLPSGHEVAAEARDIAIENNSGSRIEIYWIHPQTKERMLQSSPYVYNGAIFNLNSYVTHAFEAREMPGQKTGLCKGQGNACRSGYFTVNEHVDQVIIVSSDWEIDHTDNVSIARDVAADLMSDCERIAKKSLTGKTKNITTKTAMQVIESLVECAEGKVAKEIDVANEEVLFQERIRTTMGDHWENYTCADKNMTMTEPKDQTVFFDRKSGKRLSVDVMLDRPASKIHVIRNFITKAECDAMELAAQPRLHAATVADDKGGSRLSDNRKAKQAGISVPWGEEAQGHPIAVLSRRVYDYTNFATGQNIEHHGQEDLMSIQYVGRGDVEAPDRYMPHCDGDCKGQPHRDGGRFATMVMYCVVPEIGGATNFKNSAVHVKPEVGTATFFSYMDNDGKTDKGFTEHSGCPVIKGEKKIVTQWVRKGVDKDNRWDSWNTLGIKYDAMSD